MFNKEYFILACLKEKREYFILACFNEKKSTLFYHA